jgi:hypothetical protein
MPRREFVATVIGCAAISLTLGLTAAPSTSRGDGDAVP